jgi:hypothetical protein
MKLKRLILLPLVLVGAIVLAQVKPKPPASSGGSGVADGGAPMFSAATVVGALTVGSISVDGGISDPVGTMVLTTSAADGGTGVTLNNNVAIGVGTLLSVQNNASEKFSVSAAGNVAIPGTLDVIGNIFSSTGEIAFIDNVNINNSSDLQVSRYLDSRFKIINGNSGSPFIEATVADGASAVGNIFNTSTTWSNAGSKILSVRNNSVEKVSVGPTGTMTFGTTATPSIIHSSSSGPILQATSLSSGQTAVTLPGGNSYGYNASYGNYFSGNIYFDGNVLTSSAVIENDEDEAFVFKGNKSNGASSVGTAVDTANTFSTAGSKLFAVRNAGTEKLSINHAGVIGAQSTADTTGGACTVSKPSGRCRIGIAGTTLTVTNTLVSATTKIFATIATDDATAILKNCVPASGSFVCKTTAATTGATDIDWMIVNSI